MSGGITGGVSDLLNGGNGSGALWGAASGRLMAGANWGLARSAINAQLHNLESAMAQGDDPIYRGGNLRGVTVRAPRTFMQNDGIEPSYFFEKAVLSGIILRGAAPIVQWSSSIYNYLFNKKTSPTVQQNRDAGNAFRDELAEGLKNEGRDVYTEVYKPTPFGKRYIDIDVWYNGKNVGGIETKVGGSRYLPAQRAKDAWLYLSKGYRVNVVRKP